MFSNLKKTLAVTALVGMSAFPMVSSAAVLNSLLTPGQNTIEDTDAERVVAADGTIKTTGTFAVGDTIESILRFTTVNTYTIGDTLAAPYQLLAYSELQVKQIIDLDGSAGNAIRLIFGATGDLGAGVLANLYERTAASATTGFDAFSAPSTGIAKITSLTLAAQLGLAAGGNDIWYSDAIDDIGLIAATPSGLPQNPNGAFALSLLSNPGNINIEKNGVLSPIDGLFHDVIGGSSIYAKNPKGTNDGWLVESNTYATFASVPEPASLALLGLGLLGMGALRRRKS